MGLPILIFYVIALIIILIVAFIMARSGHFTLYQYPPPDLKAQIATYSLPSPWTKAKPVNGPDGVCKPYTFRSSSQAFPTVSYSALENGKAMTIPYLYTPTCVDTDQLFAQKMTHTCQADQGPIAGTGCVTTTGEKVSTGFVETYYENCGYGLQSTNNMDPRCRGSLSMVVTNFTPTLQNGNMSVNTCLSVPVDVAVKTVNGENIYTCNGSSTDCIVKPAPCNANDVTQFLTVERFKYEHDPKVSSTINITADTAGDFARIGHRFSGACVGPTMTPDSTGKHTLANAVPGPLRLIDCATNGYSGVWWYLSKQTSFQLDGSDPNYPKRLVYTPQQIVLFPDRIPISDLYTNDDQEATYEYFNKLLAIAVDNSGTVGNYGPVTTVPSFNGFPNAEFLNQQAYNQISNGSSGYTLITF